MLVKVNFNTCVSECPWLWLGQNWMNVVVDTLLDGCYYANTAISERAFGFPTAFWKPHQIAFSIVINGPKVESKEDAFFLHIHSIIQHLYTS